MLKSEHKNQIAELRKAIRNKKISNDKEKYRQLDEQYIKRSQLETELMNEKHDKELETLKAELDVNMRELQEIQVCGRVSIVLACDGFTSSCRSLSKEITS